MAVDQMDYILNNFRFPQKLFSRTLRDFFVTMSADSVKYIIKSRAICYIRLRGYIKFYIIYIISCTLHKLNKD